MSEWWWLWLIIGVILLAAVVWVASVVWAVAEVQHLRDAEIEDEET